MYGQYMEADRCEKDDDYKGKGIGEKKWMALFL